MLTSKDEELMKAIEADVSEAIKEVFADEDYGLNEGEEYNHCDTKTLDYLMRLSRGDPEALKREEEIAEKLSKEDFSALEKELAEL